MQGSNFTVNNRDASGLVGSITDDLGRMLGPGGRPDGGPSIDNIR